MQRIILAGLVLVASTGAAMADMKVTLGGGWNGKTVPKGQQCKLDGGKGATPAMKASGLPAGTAWVYVEYNDKDYQPLSTKGGHGIIGYPVSGSSADLYSVPGLKGSLPGKAKVIKKARGTGKYASAGYQPPCSGGNGHRYFVDLKAIGANGKVLEKKRVQIGRY